MDRNQSLTRCKSDNLRCVQEAANDCLMFETVSHALSHLRDQGVPGFSETSRRQIVLRNRQLLQKPNTQADR